MRHKSIFIGGKQIGVNCLRELVNRKINPELVIGNPDDKGDDTWHESLVKVAAKFALRILRGKKVRDPDVIEQIRNCQPEIIFCIGGTDIIPSEVLAMPRLGTLNIHPALLPRYRGRFSTAHAIFNGETSHGVTVHWMDAGIDSGPIIAQEEFPITSDDNAKTVYDKFTSVGTKLFVSFLDRWLSGEVISATPQDEQRATYYPKGLPGAGEIDWSWSGDQIRNWIRAMTFPPFPPPSFTIGDKKMVIVEDKFFTGFN